MKVTITGGTYTAEQRAVAREIVRHLRIIGLNVTDQDAIPPDAAHSVTLASLRAEGFPVQVEVCDDAFTRSNAILSERVRREEEKEESEKMYDLSAWCGPTCVEDIHSHLVSAGVRVHAPGTEHVYVSAYGTSAEAAAHNVLAALMKTHKKDYGLKFRALASSSRHSR